MQYRSAHFAVQQGVDERCLRETAKHGTELGVELCGQSLLLRFIPVLQFWASTMSRAAALRT